MTSLVLRTFDVGQAGSNLLDFGDDRYGIFDCGAARPAKIDPCTSYLRDRIEKNDSTRILFLALSHLDLDHTGGLVNLLKDPEIAPRIERLYCNHLEFRVFHKLLRRTTAGNAPFEGKFGPGLRGLLELHRLIKRKGRDFHADCTSPSPLDPAAYPVQVRIPELSPDFQLLLWGPSQYLRDQLLARLSDPKQAEAPSTKGVFRVLDYAEWNTASLVLTIDFAGRTLLLPGDADALAWREVIDRDKQGRLRADVIVAWHHGATLGSSLDGEVWRRLLSQDRCPYVVVSHGMGNPYGHPHPSMVNAATAAGGRIFCTQRRGVPRRSRPSHIPAPLSEFKAFLEPHAPWELRAPGGHACAGDITVSFLEDGSVAATGSETPVAGHTECCLRTTAPVEAG